MSGRLLANSCSFGLQYVFWYKYLNVNLVFFPPLGLLSGNFFLIALFPDLCILLAFYFNGLYVHKNYDGICRIEYANSLLANVVHSSLSRT